MRFLILSVLLILPASASHVVDGKFCGPPARDHTGNIIRSSQVTRDFKHRWKCPSTNINFGPCPGWYMDHVVPLACGGCDTVENLQWLPKDLWMAKTLFERDIYGGAGISKGCP